MAGYRPIFEMLLREENPAADDALAAVLIGGDPPTVRAATETLLARNRPAGLQGIVAAYHHLDEASRQIVHARSDRLFRVLRESLSSRNEQTRLNVLEIIRDGSFYRASYLIETCLQDRVPAVRQAAADTLYELAEKLLQEVPAPGEPLPGDPDAIRARMLELESHAEDRRQLVSAIGEAITCYNAHLQPKVIEAGMWFADDLGIKLWTPISTPGSRAMRAAIAILENSDDPRLAPFAMAAMQRAEFRPYVVKMLGSCSDGQLLAEWLREGWRLVSPRQARGMVAIKELACLTNRATGLLAVPADVQRHICRWINATGLPPETKAYVMKEAYRRGDPLAQRPALWAMVGSRDDRSSALLRIVMREPDPSCSMVAAMEMARRYPSEVPVATLLGGRPPVLPVEKPATTSEPPPMTLDRYWSLFDTLSESERAAMAPEVLRNTPRVRAMLDRQLSSADPSARMRAVRVIRSLGLLEAFAEQIYSLTFDTDPGVRSSAVAALGQVSTPTSRLVIHKALTDPDARVKANAVEAAGQQIPEGFAIADLVPMLTSTDNRVRANAVRALLKVGVREAAEALLRMLQDENRAHRISALWLVDQLSLMPLTQRVMDLAQNDGDEQVRARAAALAARLNQATPEVTS